MLRMSSNLSWNNVLSLRMTQRKRQYLSDILVARSDGTDTIIGGDRVAEEVLEHRRSHST